jgi:hypothetical protein
LGAEAACCAPKFECMSGNSEKLSSGRDILTGFQRDILCGRMNLSLSDGGDDGFGVGICLELVHQDFVHCSKDELTGQTDRTARSLELTLPCGAQKSRAGFNGIYTLLFRICLSPGTKCMCIVQYLDAHYISSKEWATFPCPISKLHTFQ